MKILISSHAFAPSVGGIETVSALLTREFVRRGHEVVVVTQTPDESEENFPFRVLRQPSLGELISLLRWSNIFWQNNLSLRTLWPAGLLRVPTVITHQGSYCRAPTGLDLVQRLKHAVVRRTPSVAISHAVADCFAISSAVIPNPFDAYLFSPGPPTAQRPNELIFVGRLVAEKGLDVLLHALAVLRGRELLPRLTIVGSGPELAPTENLAIQLGLREQIDFSGVKRGADLAGILQQHKILIVPSLYAEPFGVVALEGIASGCVVVGSSGGGLPEAIGPCGVTFPNGDASALAAALDGLLRQPDECAKMTESAAEHLGQFHPEIVAQAYLRIFEEYSR
jgi:glycogen(starch) synthase